MSVFQLKTFADFIKAMREEVGIQSTDTTAIERLKRDVNVVYQEVVAYKNWWWLQGFVSLQVPAYSSTGTAALTVGSADVTLTVAPSGSSRKGYYFAIDGFNEIFKIESHTAGATTLKLDTEFTGSTVTTATYKIWTDKLPLPTDCKETIRAWHDHHATPMEAVGLNEFRRYVGMAPRAEAKPTHYYTSEFVDPQQTSSITSLPALSTRASAGVVKTLVFASAVPTTVSTAVTANESVRIRISNAGHPSYNGDYLVSGITTTTVTNDTLIYIGPTAYQESAAADASMSVVNLDQQSEFDRYRELYVFPSLVPTRVTIHLDYVRQALSLANDSDEPMIPLEDRSVLLYGALERAWRRHRNPEEAASNQQRYENKLAKMAGKLQDSLERPRLSIDRKYLGAKRTSTTSRRFEGGMLPGGISGGSSGAVVTGDANTVATYGSNRELTSSAVTSTELGYLDGVTSNIQTQLDGKVDDATLVVLQAEVDAVEVDVALKADQTDLDAAVADIAALNTLADGKIYVGNGSNVATEVTPSGDVTITNAGVTAIASGVIVNADINASAAIARSKIATSTAYRLVANDSSGELSVNAALTSGELVQADSNGQLSSAGVTASGISYLTGAEALTSVTLNDNTASATNVATWVVATYDSVFINYTIKRGSNYEAGIINIVSDGSTASIAQGASSSIGSSGVTFTVDVSGGSLRLRYTTTSTGSNATMKYKLQKWLS